VILGIGSDIVEIGRVAEVLRAHPERFRERVFTDGEQGYCDSRARPAEHYAARFAAKEAALKALGTGRDQRVRWRDVEVLRHPSGRPELRLHGRAAERAASLGASRLHLTLSHDDERALAVVVLEGEP
jgi:holo-[acyl-carrier protein] synthase